MAWHVLEELVQMFDRRADIPDNVEWLHLGPKLDSYDFPRHILTQARLKESISDERIARTKAQLHSLGETASANQMIQYYAPCHGFGLGQSESADMVLSQAVREHVDDLDITCDALSR